MAMDFPTSAVAAECAATTDSSAITSSAAALLRRTSLSLSFAAAGGSDEPATAELARSLPELIEQLTLLRGEMEKSAKIYDAIAAGDVKTHQPASSSMSNSHSSGAVSASGAGRQSIFTPFAADTPPEAYAPIDRESVALELGDLAGGAALQRHNSKRGVQPHAQAAYPQYQQQQQQRQLPRADSRRLRNGDYTVMWVSGECGISLRNFSTNKIGAQIAVLQQAEGVTTGIANCRLGDQLVTVNDDPVETASFREIVEKLKTTRRPITLGFRTNQNVATSPVAGPTMRTLPSRHSSGGRVGSTRSFFPPDDDHRSSSRYSAPQSAPPALARGSSSKYDDAATMAAAAAAGVLESEERTTDASVRSSTSTLSDEVESWCKEQEEMHSGLLVLLTETVLRCERLQQENMDQLQNWMQVAPSLYTSSESE